VIKGEIRKTGTKTYELPITPGGKDLNSVKGTIRVGLDPYRGFPGWDAKIAYVYADWYFSFSGNSNLTITGYSQSVIDPSNIPEDIAGKQVTAIGNSAFRSKRLTNVKIPESVTSIGISAFEDNQLEDIEIPNGITTISYYAFSGNQLTHVTIPDSVTVIDQRAFWLNQLTNTSIKIPDKVSSIGDGAFGYNKFTEIKIPEGVTYLSLTTTN